MGIAEVRLYKNTNSSIPLGVYEDVTSRFDLGAGIDTETLTESLTIDGLVPSTQYWFWIQAFDEAGNDSGIIPVGSRTTAAPDVWEFYSIGADGVYQTIRQFEYSGPGSFQLSSDYSRVALFNLYENSATSADVMGSDELETVFSQLVWETGSVATPKLMFTIEVPPNAIPTSGWSWIQGSHTLAQRGAYLIKRNGVTLAHTGENVPVDGANPRSITDV